MKSPLKSCLHCPDLEWKENDMTHEKFKETFMNLHHRTPYQP